MDHFLVTGVSSGIGEALTESLMAKGSFVFGSLRSKEKGKELTEKFGASFHPLYFDVTSEKEIASSFDEVREKLGEQNLKGLINNAGTVIPGPLLEMESSSFRNQWEVNVLNPFLMIKTFHPLLLTHNKSQSPGRIINISSLSGVRTFPYLAAYSSSKFALEALNDGFRRELFGDGIDVISILPGPIKTSLTDKINERLKTSAEDSKYRESILKFIRMNEKKANSGVPLDLVIQTILKALYSPHPKVRYYLKSSFITDTLLGEYFPTRWFDRMIAKTLGIVT
ncbi:SDR family NAD(P)-dependent oxidoreductase [Leptospira idonii]|uniref:SDR family NAD(P)-dependent oxidoreductase n=1 Tax=Leptospira idonii TaxID=1193500 RepID=A0A4R9LZ57_9LEPT|nr:SDR family NAD(P)-dependent oxidoreductase [Leptospira idonii]TGN18627.1 SDR family NAD(P)-dependent oxidoreductase [Leptospira idonii]